MGSHASLSTPRVQTGTLYFVALLREELGRRIATARKGAGLSQQDLAAAIGLKHAQDVSRYERGKVEVPSARIDLIAEATGRPRSYFTRDPAEAETGPEDERLTRVEEQVAALPAQMAEAMRSVLQDELRRLLEEQQPQLGEGTPRRRASDRRG